MANSSKDFYTGLIANVGSSHKFLEFQDAMVVPYAQHYGMLQGAVGNKYAPNSGIRVTISEYDDGNRTTGVGSALLPSYLFSEIRHICLKNLEEPIICGESASFIESQSRLTSCAGTLLGEMKSGIAKTLKTSDGNLLSRIGSAVKLAQYRLAGYQSDGITPVGDSSGRHRLERGTDFSYHQERFHASRANSDGSCHCCTVDISRRTFIEDTLSRSPWLIKISSFNAKPVKGPNGSEGYSPSSVSEREDHTFRLSDQDMFRCCYAVEHFVSQWERATLPDFVLGMNETARKREEHLSEKAV